jgi:hypothetical protein
MDNPANEQALYPWFFIVPTIEETKEFHFRVLNDECEAYLWVRDDSISVDKALYITACKGAF